MDEIRKIIVLIDGSLNTERRCHITGGILISISLLFCGLALTVLSIKPSSERILDSSNSEYKLIYPESEGDSI